MSTLRAMLRAARVVARIHKMADHAEGDGGFEMRFLSGAVFHWIVINSF
jgi:hypothetical protein